MSHRAEQIIDAVVSAIRAQAPSSVKVYAHRRLSLADDQGELPAISVDYGEDVPVEDEGSYLLDGTIQSLITVNVTGLAVSPEEPALRRTLLELRTHAHIAVKNDARLGLPFVIDTHYGGAIPPEFDVSGETLVGELTSQWGVRYEMQLSTPE